MYNIHVYSRTLPYGHHRIADTMVIRTKNHAQTVRPFMLYFTPELRTPAISYCGQKYFHAAQSPALSISHKASASMSLYTTLYVKHDYTNNFSVLFYMSQSTVQYHTSFTVFQSNCVRCIFCSLAICDQVCLKGGSCGSPNVCDCHGTGYTGSQCQTRMYMFWSIWPSKTCNNLHTILKMQTPLESLQLSHFDDILH